MAERPQGDELHLAVPSTWSATSLDIVLDLLFLLLPMATGILHELG
jgi:hypothetical protein